MSDDGNPNPLNPKAAEAPAPAIEATIGFDSKDQGQRLAGGDLAATKQDQDLAFAAMLLRSRAMNEQQLSQSIENWTTYGLDSLADHLVGERLITTEQSHGTCDEPATENTVKF